MKESIENIVLDAVKEINVNLTSPVVIENSDANLYGDGGNLDSMALVTLVMSIEERLQDELDVDVLLANEKAMSQKRSPFKTVQSLVTYIDTLITEAGEVSS